MISLITAAAAIVPLTMTARSGSGQNRTDDAGKDERNAAVRTEPGVQKILIAAERVDDLLLGEIRTERMLTENAAQNLVVEAVKRLTERVDFGFQMHRRHHHRF